MSLPTALAESCDTWFYRLGDLVYTPPAGRRDLGIQTWAHMLGLGKPTGVDLTGERAASCRRPRG